MCLCEVINHFLLLDCCEVTAAKAPYTKDDDGGFAVPMARLWPAGLTECLEETKISLKSDMKL